MSCSLLPLSRSTIWIMLLASVVPLQAQTLLHQPRNNGFFSWSDLQCDLCGGKAVVAAEDFVLATPRTIVEVIVWGHYYQDVTFDDVFRVKIFEDDGGTPSSQHLYRRSGIAPVRQDTGEVINGRKVFRYSVQLADVPTLSPGTYWIEVANDSRGKTGDYGWLGGTLDPARGRPDAVFSADEGATWIPAPGTDHAIRIEGNAPPPCEPSKSTACLQDDRFEVMVDWRDFNDNTGSAKVVPGGSNDSGLFYFFQKDNWEMLVKVLDKCGGKSDRFWVFAAATTDVEYTLRVTDTETAEVKEYFNPLGNASPAITDTSAFDTCNGPKARRRTGRTGRTGRTVRLDDLESHDGIVVHDLLQSAAPQELAAGGISVGCDPSGKKLCLSQGRFEVSVDWRDFNDNTGPARVVPFGSDDSGLFYFFEKNNWEMLVKVLDKCGGKSNRFWVFAAATTNVEYTMRVTDTMTGKKKEYSNPLGTASPAITDTSAFATCP